MKTSLFICVWFAALLFSCKKKRTIDHSSEPLGSNCSATKTNAEAIRVFPSDNSWNQDISAAPVHPNSAQIIAPFAGNPIKADFGSGLWNGAPIGIPYVVVCGNQAKVPVEFTDYGDESDPGPYPIPLNAPIEGNGSGDAHVIAVDIENKKLYEQLLASEREKIELLKNK